MTSITNSRGRARPLPSELPPRRIDTIQLLRCYATVAIVAKAELGQIIRKYGRFIASEWTSHTVAIRMKILEDAYPMIPSNTVPYDDATDGYTDGEYRATHFACGISKKDLVQDDILLRLLHSRATLPLVEWVESDFDNRYSILVFCLNPPRDIRSLQYLPMTPLRSMREFRRATSKTRTNCNCRYVLRY